MRTYCLLLGKDSFGGKFDAENFFSGFEALKKQRFRAEMYLRVVEDILSSGPKDGILLDLRLRKTSFADFFL